MTLLQIEKKVRALENQVRHLAQSRPGANRRWYRAQAGEFANDRVFDEVVKLGRAYRDSLRPRNHRRRS
jgi:hypothetical protein